MAYVGKKQKTLVKPVKCSGIGLHTGENITMNLLPAPTGTGIKFRRTDIKDIHKATINAKYDNVTKTTLGTTISNESGTEISTVEHLLSAISAYGLDNMLIELDGPEIPVMDGSASPFLFFIECAGIKEVSAPKKYLKLTKTIKVTDGDKYAELSPCDGFHMAFYIDFDQNIIGKQSLAFEFSTSFFKTEISRARTFGFAEQIDQLRAMGLARGGSVDNAIVIQDGEVINKNGLRYADEFVRHKILDAVGDLHLAGAPIIGQYKAYKSGHDLNNKLLRKAFKENAFEAVQYDLIDKSKTSDNHHIEMSVA